MKRRFSALTPFYYLYYLVSPLHILQLIRHSFFATFSKIDETWDFRGSGLYFLTLNIMAIGFVAALGMYHLFPLFGHAFHISIAARVFLGFIAGFFLYSIFGNLYTALKSAVSDESAIDGFKSTPIVFFLGTPAAVAGALCAGIAGNQFLGVLVAGCELATIPASFFPGSGAMKAIFGCVFGGMLAAIGLAMSGVHLPIAAWLPKLGTALLVALGLLTVLLIILVTLSRFFRPRNPAADYVLVLFSVPVTAVLLSHPLAWFADSIHAVPLPRSLIALTCVLVVTRLPLWPLEVLWARLSFAEMLSRAVRVVNASAAHYQFSSDKLQQVLSYRRALRAAFFDRRILLPLPGEVDALLALARVSTQLACEEAADLLTFTPRSHSAKAVLRRLAQQDPLGTFSPISDLRVRRESNLAPGEIERQMTGASALVWQALILIARCRVQADGPVAAAAERSSEQQLADFYRVTPQLIEQAGEKLQQAAAIVERAVREPQVPRGTGLLLALLQQSLRELGNRDAYLIKPIEVSLEMMTELEDQIYTKNDFKLKFDRFHNDNWLARSINTISPDSSISIKKTKLLELMSGMNLYVSMLPLKTNRLLREKTPGAWLLDEILLPVEFHWQLLIAEAAQQIVKAEPQGPIENPFVVGPPVRGSQFIGRQKLMMQLTSLWGNQPQWPSVLLHGHRRMGKSSILHNLSLFVAGQNVTLAILSMQELGEISGPKEFLRHVARKLRRSLSEAGVQAGDDEIALFDKFGPYEAFDEFLQTIKRSSGARRILIGIDEYERIDELINNKIIEVRLLEFFRALIDENPWLCFVFAGNHTHNELDQEHWQLLFRTIMSIRVSFLSDADARLLLTAPTADFPVSYQPAELNQAVSLTAGQPFLLQLLGFSLLERVNDRRRLDPKVALSIEASDLRAVVDDPEFYHRGAGYFDGVMRQVAADRPEPAALLRALCGDPRGVDIGVLATASQLEPARFQAVLSLLLRHEVLQKTEANHVCFTVELMRRFVMQRFGVQPAPSVRDKEIFTF